MPRPFKITDEDKKFMEEISDMQEYFFLNLNEMWTYKRIADHIGCTPIMVSKYLKSIGKPLKDKWDLFSLKYPDKYLIKKYKELYKTGKFRSSREVIKYICGDITNHMIGEEKLIPILKNNGIDFLEVNRKIKEIRRKRK